MNPPHSPYDSICDTDEEAYEKYYSPSVVKDVSDLLNRKNVIGDIANDKVRYYFSHITGVDKQFGRILEAIEECNLKDNTIVVFTSDHGEMMGSHNLLSKDVPFEESIGIPFLIRYPAKLRHRIEDLLLSPVDIMPTFLGLIGLQDKIPEGVQGTDYSPLLLNPDSDIVKPRSALYIFEGDGSIQRRGVRTYRYTMVIEIDRAFKSRKLMLYDNIEDPYQMDNLSAEDLDKKTLDALAWERGYWLNILNL